MKLLATKQERAVIQTAFSASSESLKAYMTPEIETMIGRAMRSKARSGGFAPRKFVGINVRYGEGTNHYYNMLEPHFPMDTIRAAEISGQQTSNIRGYLLKMQARGWVRGRVSKTRPFFTTWFLSHD